MFLVPQFINVCVAVSFNLQMTGILSWIVRSWTDVENNIVSVERVKEYDNTVKEVRNAQNIQKKVT